MTEALRCPACGDKTTSGARFCRRCGSDLEIAAELKHLGAGPVEQGPAALDEAASLRELWWLCGLPVAISVVFAILARLGGASTVLELLVLGAIALVALAGSFKNPKLVLSGLRLPTVPSVVWTLLVACIVGPLLMAAFSLLEALGFAFESDYLLPYLLDGWPLWTGYVTTAVITPITEELLFRGLLQPKLEHVLTSREALVVQAVLFSAAHLSPVILATHFVMGLCFGWIRRKSGSLYPSILLHAAWNAWVIWSSSR